MGDYDPSQRIEEYLEAHESKELLRFVSVGSVDDGKSTLIGRLLHDTHGIYEDQLSAVKRATKAGEGVEDIDFSLFTDGLKAEREQKITIDVAYRYFSTAKRKFIIADTPGHVQYTRNMATGASTANVALILIDARHGVLAQSRRHAYIASLLGIPHLAVCVNKMDLKGFAEEVFDSICAEFARFARRLDFAEVKYLPISALLGDNVVHASDRMGWHAGGTLLDYLETVEVTSDRNFDHFRFPVQNVLRPNLDYRGFSGEISSGVVREGDEVIALPSEQRSRVIAIDTFEGPLAEAFPPMNVTLKLADEIDLSRGDMLVRPDDRPHVASRFEAMLVWMSERPLDLAKSYLLRHTTRTVRAEVEGIEYRTDLETLDREPASELGLNDIASVSVRTHQPIYFDGYRGNRSTGAFVLIDSLTNDTVAAGMILEPEVAERRSRARDEGPPRTQVSPTERRERLGQHGLTIWLTGRPGSGKTKVAYALERRLFDAGYAAVVVDPGDDASTPNASAGALANDAHAPEHAGELARRMTDAGLIAIFAFASPTALERATARSRVGARFVEVHVSGGAPTLAHDAPASPLVTVSLERADPEHAAGTIVRALDADGLLGARRGRGAAI